MSTKEKEFETEIERCMACISYGPALSCKGCKNGDMFEPNRPSFQELYFLLMGNYQ